MINLYLISDQEIFKDKIRLWIKSDSEIRLAGAVNKNLQALRNLREIEADIIALDIETDDQNGKEIMRDIKERAEENKILLLYPAGMEKSLIGIYEEGTKGFLMKDSGKDDFILALKKLYKNKKFICSELAMEMLEAKKEKTPSPLPVKPNLPVDISKREMEVLKLISEGFKNHEIADKLFTSRRTIETHRKNLIQKTETKNTAHLIRYAVHNGIIK